MFTVKHIGSFGQEELFQTPTFSYSPGINANEGGVPTVYVERGDSELDITGGMVFVMNDSGKTVARYKLGVSADDADPNQLSFTNISAEKDGGLAAEAVDTLRGAPIGRMAAE
jgi:hypothetical protein